jgi:CheY-like chemotaxis protein
VKRRILIIEDDDAVRMALGRLLTRSGYQVQLAPDGRRGLSIARMSQPDLILMDLGMPEMDGWTATGMLKASDVTRDIPVIILSAHTLPAERDHAMAQGCDDFQTKPVRIEELVDKIERALKRKTAA